MSVKLPLYNQRLHEVRYKDQTIDQMFIIRSVSFVIRFVMFTVNINKSIFFLLICHALSKLLPFNKKISYLLKINLFSLQTKRALIRGDAKTFANLKKSVLYSKIDFSQTRDFFFFLKKIT